MTSTAGRRLRALVKRSLKMALRYDCVKIPAFIMQHREKSKLILIAAQPKLLSFLDKLQFHCGVANPPR